MTKDGFLGLGSNLGDSRARLEQAAAGLEGPDLRVLASSSVYETEPVGEIIEQPPFLNACLHIRTGMTAQGLLAVAKRLEQAMGRVAGAPRHAPRPIDIDLLLLGEEPHSSPGIEIPHPTLLERRFVLIPLLELDPAARTPEGVNLLDALASLPLEGQSVRWAGPPLLGQAAPGASPADQPQAAGIQASGSAPASASPGRGGK